MDHEGNTLYHSASFHNLSRPSSALNSTNSNNNNNKNNKDNNKQALTLEHAYSFECKANDAIHNLSDAKRNALFFVSGHIGVIYDLDRETQQHLLGHAHAITCCCVSADRAFIVTADAGLAGANAGLARSDAGHAHAGDANAGESLIIVWNSLTASPIRILSPVSSCVYALDLSFDASLLAVISSSSSPSSSSYDSFSSSPPSQVLSLYHWTTDTTDTPLASHPVPAGDPIQYLRFHPSDPSLLISNSKDRVVFWHTFPSLVPYSPPLTSKDFRHPVGNFTQSTFLPPFDPSPTPSSNYISYTAASATQEGDVVVWDVPPFIEDEDWGIRGIKALQLHQGPIKVLTATSDHIVTGGEEGFVRFFDPQFRILAWFEDLVAGSISAISFSRVPPDPYDTSEFKDSEFVVGTRSGIVVNIQPSSWEHPDSAMRRGRPVLQAHCASVYGIASHPSMPLLATAGHSGDVHIWQYETQSLLVSRRFDKLMAHRVAFSPDGEHIAIGFTNGTVKMVYTEDLQDVPQSSHRQSRDCITEMVFSLDGKNLATSDADRCVVLYQLELGQDDQVIWAYIGKYRAHIKPITGLIFGTSADASASGPTSGASGHSIVNRLMSLAEDRTLVEFDIAASSVSAGLVLKSRTKIEQVAVPTAITWHPRLGKEDFLIVASDQYKFKLYNSNTKSCRKTILGPTYGGPLNRIVNIPTTPSAQNRYLAYGTHERVMGLMKLPLDGNPHRTMGLIAHAGEIAGLCASYDAKYIFSAGGADGTVYAWRADYNSLDALADAVDADVDDVWDASVAPFVALLNRAGAGEAFWTELQDYFYFAQLKSQGEDTMRPRHIGPTVPLAQVPHIMRGLGYYPTEREVEDLVNELKFTNFVDTGEQIEEVTLDTIIKAYVNHKPVFGVSEGHVEEAFRALGADVDGGLSLDYLLLQLQYKGEAMSETEIKECLRALLGEEAQYKLEQLKELTAGEFAEHILGFEPLNQDEAP